MNTLIKVFVYSVYSGLIILFNICLALFIVIQPWFVRYEYAKSSVAPEPAAFITISYLKTTGSPDQTLKLLQPFYSTSEIAHLQAVKQLTDLARLALPFAGLSLIGLLAFAKTRRGRLLVTGGLVNLGLIGLIFLLIQFAWAPFFIGFHEVIFPQGNWAFPESSLLIRLFPETFWQTAFLVVGLFITIFSFIEFLSGLILNRIYKPPHLTRSLNYKP